MSEARADAPAAAAPVALVVGGARGIGAGVVEALAQRGSRVVIGYRESAEAARALAESIGDERSLTLQADVAQPEQARTLVARAVERWGRLDALICAAGDFVREPLLEQSTTRWREVFDENLHSVFDLAQAAAPALERAPGGGRVVTFGIANGRAARAQTHVTAYYIAKVGVQILTRSLAEALGPRGVTVNCVSPGFIDTGTPLPDPLARVAQRVPLGRVGGVDDVVGAVCFLLSDEARYISGADLQVSGGWGT